MKETTITRREFIKKSTATVASTAVVAGALAETTEAAIKPKLPQRVLSPHRRSGADPGLRRRESRLDVSGRGRSAARPEPGD